MEETFTYDDMNRLTGVTLKRPSGQDLHCAMTYDALGRMTSREAVTASNGIPQVTSVFSQPVFDATKVHALASATTAEGVFPSTSQTVTYTGFDKVSKVKQGVDSICYAYGYDQQRTFMEEHVGSTVRTKRYVGNCEYITETNASNTDTQWLTYLSGPTGVYAVVLTKSGSDQIFYILKDNLGSWTAITDNSGNTEQRLSYDAWGNLRNPQTWSGDFSGTPMFDRGFTGHEHLYNFGLINMNGRMYDPMMSSFLSADQYVSSPETAQGFNRYAYCMNNPLRYVDPTGWLAGGGVGTYGEHPLWVPYYVNDMITIDLPEATILADNPSLSNTYEYEEFEYTPNITSGGFDNGWGNTSGWSSDRRFRGSGGGNGNNGSGNRSIDIAAGVLATMWGISVAEPTPGGEAISGVATIAAGIYFGEELYTKMEEEIARLEKRLDGPDGFVYELRANTDGLYPCVRTSTWVYLEAGEVWKIGETTQLDGGRYSKQILQSIGAGGVTPFPVFYGNQREIKIQEKIMIYGYYFKHGFLPPGNKIFR